MSNGGGIVATQGVGQSVAPASRSVAVSGAPMLSPAAVFSSMVRVAGSPSSNAGGSFASVTVMVTSWGIG